MPQSLRLLLSFFPPDLSAHYLRALAQPLFETLALVIAAMTVVVLVSLPLAIWASMGTRRAQAAALLLSLLRAVPDLTLAIFCVILFGLGPGAGLMALVLYYTAATTRMFADLLRTAPAAPLEALAATGATRLQIALYGRLPLTARDLFDGGAYSFECALRSSVIIGAVGAGGIGTELVGSLSAYDFHRAATQILLLLVLIAGLDRLALWAQRRPSVLLGVLPFGLAAAWWQAPRIFAWRHALGVFAGMFPPSLGGDALAQLPQLIAQTLAMAIAGTLAGGAAALLVAPFAARRFAPAWLVFAARRGLEVFRTIPEVVWGLVLVAVVGIGPVSGAWALGLHSFGSLGRLFADALDAAPRQPQDALASTGASPLAITLYGTLPLALGPIAAQTLFRLDWNLRMATVLGMIGAGGIGQALYQAQQLFFYQQVMAYLLVTAAVIVTADFATARLARLFRMSQANWGDCLR